MSSFVCVFCSRCRPNSVNTFPIVITDQMQPHCIRCLLHDLRDGGGLCPHLGCRLSGGQWWRIVLAGSHLLRGRVSFMYLPVWLFPNPNTHSPKYTRSLDQTTQMHAHVPVGVVDVATKTLLFPRKQSLLSQLSDGLVHSPGSRHLG